MNRSSRRSIGYTSADPREHLAELAPRSALEELAVVPLPRTAADGRGTGMARANRSGVVR